MATKSPTQTSRRVAFLRAINVGGTGTLKMEELRRLAEAAGLRDVTTLGASGNVLFTSRRTAKTDAQRFAKLLIERMGKGTVVVRDANEMANIVQNAPFVKPDATVPDKWRFIAFLEKPSKAALPDLPGGSPVRYAGRTAREIFYTMAEPTSHAIAMAGRIERSLGTSLTVRNWNVVRQIAALLNT